MPHSAYMVCDRSIIDCDFILRLYLCVYHSLHDGHRWWSCWQAQRTSVSKRWIHRVHDQLTRKGKSTIACTLRSLRLDGTTWGGTPAQVSSKVASLVIYTGEQLCQLTVELCSSSKLRAFACGDDTTMMVASRPVRSQAPIPHLTDAIYCAAS